MDRSKQRGIYEGYLSRAHRNAWSAAQHAEAAGDVGGAEDLHEICKFLKILLEDSIRGHKRPLRGQDALFS